MLGQLVVKLLKVYGYLSSLKGFRICRFYPTCSRYSATAIEKFGVFKGSFLGLKRILKCHPFHPGGIDEI